MKAVLCLLSRYCFVLLVGASMGCIALPIPHALHFPQEGVVLAMDTDGPLPGVEIEVRSFDVGPDDSREVLSVYHTRSAGDGSFNVPGQDAWAIWWFFPFLPMPVPQYPAEEYVFSAPGYRALVYNPIFDVPRQEFGTTGFVLEDSGGWRVWLSPEDHEK